MDKTFELEKNIKNINDLKNQNTNTTWIKRSKYFDKIQSENLYSHDKKYPANNFTVWLRKFCKSNGLSYYTIMHERSEARLLTNYVDSHNKTIKDNKKKISIDDVAKHINIKSAQSILRIASGFIKNRREIEFELISRTINSTKKEGLNSYRLLRMAENVTEAKRILQNHEHANDSKKDLEKALLQLKVLIKNDDLKGDDWTPQKSKREIIGDYTKIKVKKAPCFRVYAVPDIQKNYDALLIENYSISKTFNGTETKKEFEEVNIHGFKMCQNTNVQFDTSSTDKSFQCLDYLWLVFQKKSDVEQIKNQNSFFTNLFYKLPTLKGIGVIFFDGKRLRQEKIKEKDDVEEDIKENTVTNSLGNQLDRFIAKNALMSTIFIGLIAEATDSKELDGLNTNYKSDEFNSDKGNGDDIDTTDFNIPNTDHGIKNFVGEKKILPKSLTDLRSWLNQSSNNQSDFDLWDQANLAAEYLQTIENISEEDDS